MSPSVEAVVLGVVANVITSLIYGPFRKAEKKQIALKPLLKKAIEEGADVIEWTGPPRVEEICLFLATPEVESVIRQFYSYRLSTVKKDPTNLIKQEFTGLFVSYFGLTGQSSARAESLFEYLIKTSAAALDKAIDTGALSAHEAKSSARYRQLQDELAAIQKNLEFLTNRQKPNIKAILEFEKTYREQISESRGRITPPNFDSARRLAIDDIYVAPSFLSFARAKGKPDSASDEGLTLAAFLTGIYRAVLLGNPGGGKSTLVNKICYDLSERYEQRYFAGRQLTPIPIVLRDYGAEKKAKNVSIVEFMELQSKSDYQIKPPTGGFEYLLLNGRAVVIFDGLDELLETNHRQKITNDIEAFCNLYPAVPVLITSREVGYEQAPLSEERFEAYRLAPFNENQITEYVTKWFSVDEELLPTQRAHKTESFLKESAIVPDLRSNPLMLALMCNIYRGENYIPQNRPDLYEKCAVMLFERWDKNRGIMVPLPFEAHIRPAMMYLAHWIYTDEKLQSGVGEQTLINKTADYLLERRYDDRDEAKLSAKDFIEFCKGRAWVFTDTGAGLYQFTHRTFLEYFTAYHLVRTNSSPEALKNVLIRRVAKREWDIVAQLAIQLQDDHLEGAADQILIMLLNEAEAKEINDREGWNLISFAARCLQFLVPSSKVRRRVADDCIQRYIRLGRHQANHPKPDESEYEYVTGRERILYPLPDLLSATKENVATISRAITENLTTAIQGRNTLDAELAVEINTYIPVSLRHSRRETTDESQIQLWQNISNQIYDDCRPSIRKLAKESVGVANIAFWWRDITAKQFINYHGASIFFKHSHYKLFPMAWSAAAQLLGVLLRGVSHSNQAINASHIEKLKRDRHEVRTVGKVLFQTTLPWCKQMDARFMGRYYFEYDTSIDVVTVDEAWDSELIFGGFAMVATALEAAANRRGNLTGEIMRGLRQSSAPLLQVFRYPLLARFEEVDPTSYEADIQHAGLSSEQESLVRRWSNRELDFVEKAPLKRRAKRKVAKKK